MNQYIDAVYDLLDTLRSSNNMTYQAYSQLHDLISFLSDSLKEQPKWISVKDGLPKKNGKYIVFSESPICKSMLFANFAKNLQKIDKNAFYEMKCPGWYEYDSDWGYYELNYITHWMPQPNPPEMKRG